MAGYAKTASPAHFTALTYTWEQLWQQAPQLKPNLHALTIYIAACQAQRTADAAQLAQDALKRFYQNQSTGETTNHHNIDDENENDNLDDEQTNNSSNTINVQVVTSVLDCWQKSGAREAGPNAQALLQWLVQEYQVTQNCALQPNAYTFSAAIGAWARSRRFGKARQAQALLQWMQQLHKQGMVSDPPNVYCYTGVINSCAYCEKDPTETKQALDIAVDTYHQLQQQQESDDKQGGPTHVTYAAFLTALRNLVPPSPKRTAVVTKVFTEAARRGQVGDLVVQRLQSVVTANEAQTIWDEIAAAGDNEIEVSWNKIPASWRRHVTSSWQA